MASAPTVICSELRIRGKCHVNITFWMIILNSKIVKSRLRYQYGFLYVALFNRFLFQFSVVGGILYYLEFVEIDMK